MLIVKMNTPRMIRRTKAAVRPPGTEIQLVTRETQPMKANPLDSIIC